MAPGLLIQLLPKALSVIETSNLDKFEFIV